MTIYLLTNPRTHALPRYGTDAFGQSASRRCKEQAKLSFGQRQSIGGNSAAILFLRETLRRIFMRQSSLPISDPDWSGLPIRVRPHESLALQKAKLAVGNAMSSEDQVE